MRKPPCSLNKKILHCCEYWCLESLCGRIFQITFLLPFIGPWLLTCLDRDYKLLLISLCDIVVYESLQKSNTTRLWLMLFQEWRWELCSVNIDKIYDITFGDSEKNCPIIESIRLPQERLVGYYHVYIVLRWQNEQVWFHVLSSKCIN